jgi:hypothetical protein
MTSRIKTGVILFLLFAASCIEQFNPPRESSDFLGYLVVDGYLDGNNGTANISLSRSTGLTEYRANPRETDASVKLELEDGGTFELKERKDGLYNADNLALDSKSRYRIRVATKYGATYTSEYIELRKSPAFDSVVWRAEDKGIRLYVNGHDDSGNTRYYQYRFTETWAYWATFVSRYKNIAGYPVKRTNKEFVHDCWDSRNNPDIIVKSTSNLERDALIMAPLYLIDKGSRKLIDTYSIIVEQRAISEQEFQFWELLRKTNETLGGLFDPIPSQVVGNVRCDDNPNEPVFGHISGGYSKKIRIFIRYKDLPQSHRDIDPLSYECGINDFIPGGDHSIGSDVYIDLHTAPNTWYVTSANCGDCRSLGGDTLRPSYWPQ